jgi:hypothetical protein
MTDTNELSTNTTGEARSKWLDAIVHNRLRTAYILYAVAVLFAALAIASYARFQGEWAPVTLWFAGIASVAAMGGIWQQIREPDPNTELDMARMFVLAIGGAVGLLTTVFLGVGLAFKWQNTISGGWKVWQGENGWQLWVIVAALFGGLAIMFMSLQAVRADVRSNAWLRRLVYGYNALLTGLLLLAILIIVNVLANTPWGPFKYVEKTYPWAEASIYSLSSKSENILDGLQKPVKVFVIFPSNHGILRPTRALLDNAQNVTSKLEVEYLSPDNDLERVKRLADEYKFGEREGILVVYGTPPNVNSRFIKVDDLVEAPDFASRSQQRVYQGEKVLMTELSFMSEGKEKPVIYFTQGHGELDLSDTNPRSPVGKGLGVLKQRLETGNYQVKGLQFSPVAGVAGEKPDVVISTKVPDGSDGQEAAAVLVIAGPTQPFEDFALKAIREFVEPTDPGKPKGKLIVLFDVETVPQQGLVKTGLEPIFSEWGVEVGNNRLLHLPTNLIRNPTQILAYTSETEARRPTNPIAAAFPDPVILYGARTIDPKAADASTPAKLRAETLLFATPNQYLWAETDVLANPMELVDEVMRKGDTARLSRKALSAAVTVSEPVPGAGGGAHAGMQMDQKPRMVVFGDSAIVSNALTTSPGTGIPYFDLFSSCLSWLRERPSNIGIEPKKSDVFVVNPAMNTTAMVWVPLVLMLVGIIGLGAGVWVVRRR